MRPQFQTRVENILEKFAKLELWAGAIANRAIQNHERRQSKNIAAEDAAARQAAGWPEPETEGEDVGDTILGDVVIQQPAASPAQPQLQTKGGGLAKLAVATLLGAAVPGAGIAGYLLNSAGEAIQAPATDTDTTTQIGLGKIEDYLKAEP